MDRFEEIFGFVPVGGPVIGAIELQLVNSVLNAFQAVAAREYDLLKQLEEQAKKAETKEQLFQLLKAAKEQSQKSALAHGAWHEAQKLAKQANRYTESK